jgi:hypothetical protein
VFAVKCFEEAERSRPEEVRAALELDRAVPFLLCDARRRDSVKTVLITLVEHAMRLAQRRRPGPRPGRSPVDGRITPVSTG